MSRICRYGGGRFQGLQRPKTGPKEWQARIGRDSGGRSMGPVLRIGLRMVAIHGRNSGERQTAVEGASSPGERARPAITANARWLLRNCSRSSSKVRATGNCGNSSITFCGGRNRMPAGLRQHRGARCRNRRRRSPGSRARGTPAPPAAYTVGLPQHIVDDPVVDHLKPVAKQGRPNPVAASGHGEFVEGIRQNHRLKPLAQPFQELVCPPPAPCRRSPAGYRIISNRAGPATPSRRRINWS